MTKQEGSGRADFDLPSIAAPATQDLARLIVAPPLPDPLARGLAVIQYRAENLRIVPVFGPAALSVTPRIGHIHVTLDDADWHWVDASGEPLIIQGLAPGPHRVLIELADPAHRVIDSKTVSFEILSGRTPNGHRHQAANRRGQSWSFRKSI